MLTHLIILLNDSSVSYCHYEVVPTKHRQMPLGILKRGIAWAMKENLNIQFVYPDYQLPDKYRETIETIDHTKIGSANCGENLDVTILKDLDEELKSDGCYLW